MTQYGDRTEASPEELRQQILDNLDKDEWKGCVGSTKCCTLFQLTHKLDEFEKEIYEAHHGRKRDAVGIEYAHVCNKLDTKTGKCTIYDNRPRICRNFYCNASKAREKIHTLLKLEIEEKGKFDADEFDIHKWLSEIGEGEGKRYKTSSVEPKNSE